MQIYIQNILSELEVYGKTNDLVSSNRNEKMLNITPDTGAFLSVIVQASKAKRILEIGTSNGYSTIWLASAAANIGGKVTTVEIQEHKIKKAEINFAKSGLSEKIQLIQGDAGKFLNSSGANSFDLIFLDSERNQYVEWLSEIFRVLAPGGLLIVDNAISHKNELTEFKIQIEKNGFENSLVPIGNGEFVVLKPILNTNF